MSEKTIVQYSDFIHDDGGFDKLKSDFDKLGADLVSQANELKKKVSSSMNFSMVGGMDISGYEAEVKKLVEMQKQYAEATKQLQRVQAEYNKSIAFTEQAERELEKTKRERLKTEREEINLQRAKNQLASQMEAQARRASKATDIETNAYKALSAQLRALFNEAADVAVQMDRLEKAGQTATPAYASLTAQFDRLQKEVSETDGTLKRIDASLGRHQRNVGNYASGWNGLSNSINQVTRELPSFTFSAQTGFLAISNNLPILVDEIARLNTQNATLKKEGKQTVPVINQIASALFSWQTLLSVGITLLTLYGKEIGNWVSGLFGASDALDELIELQNKFNKATSKGAINEVGNVQAFQRDLKTAQDTTLSWEEREIAIKRVRDAVGLYAKDISDAEIANGKLAISEQEIVNIIEKRGKALEEIEAVQKQREKILELRAEREQAIIDLQIASANKQFSNNFGMLSMYEIEISKLESKIKNIDKAILEGAKTIKEREDQALKTYAETIALDWRENKQRKERIRDLQDQINQVDYLASEYALLNAQLNATASAYERIAGSPRYEANIRLDAEKRALDLRIRQEKEALEESKRLIAEKYEEEKNAMIKDENGKLTRRKYTENGLKELHRQYLADIETAEVESQNRIEQKKFDYVKKGYIERQKMQIQFLEEQLRTLDPSMDGFTEKYNDLMRQISVLNQSIIEITDKAGVQSTKDRLQIAQNELAYFEKLAKRFVDRFGTSDLSKMNRKQRKQALAELKQFEEDQLRMQHNFEVQRLQSQINYWRDQQKLFEKGTTAWNELEIKILNAQTELEKKQIENGKKRLEDFKDFAEGLYDIVGQILDRMIDITQKRISREEQLLDKQNDMVESQRERANNGLENSLAFEQKMALEREKSLLKQQKREERLLKIRSLWASYTSYAQSGNPDGAFAKAMRDFALLEAVTLSFGDGGVVEDKLPSNGIFRGQSHSGNRGGIPIMVEGKEGIFSKREMENLGKDNFYDMKRLAGSGKIGRNFFSKQNSEIMSVHPIVQNNDRFLAKKLDEVKSAIENQPRVSNGYTELSTGVIKIVEEISTKNHTKRNTRIIRKPRP